MDNFEARQFYSLSTHFLYLVDIVLLQFYEVSEMLAARYRLWYGNSYYVNILVRYLWGEGVLLVQRSVGSFPAR